MRKLILLAGLALIYFTATSCIYEAPYWTSDGKKLVVGALYNDEKGAEQYQFFMVDLVTKEAKALTDFTENKNGIGAALSPDGTKLAYFFHDNDQIKDNEMDLRIMDPATRESKTLLKLSKEDEKSHYTLSPWSPKGDALLATNYVAEKKIYQLLWIDLQGQSKVLVEGDRPIQACWSPLGESIAYTVAQKRTYDLVLLHLQNKTQRTVAKNVPLPRYHAKDLIYYAVPSWSSDGTQIAYVNGRQIAVVNLANSSSKDLTSGPGQKVYPRWSPDGKKIAFMRVKIEKKDPTYGGNQSEIFSIDAEGKHVKMLTRLKGEAYLPQWSPQGDRIAFLFARKNEVTFLPGVVNLSGEVNFFPINDSQKIGLAKYYINSAEEESNMSLKESAQKILKGVASDSPNTKWGEEAAEILDSLKSKKKHEKASESQAKPSA